MMGRKISSSLIDFIFFLSYSKDSYENFDPFKHDSFS